VLVARTATAAATLAPWSKAMRAERWFAAKHEATNMRMTIPVPGDSLACMRVAIISCLLAFPAAGFACEYPDQGTMPLHRAVTRVKYLPEIEAWAKAQTSAVQYALLLDRTRQVSGRCYWTLEVRTEGKVWRRYYVAPDGKRLFPE
jgi:hypothetical protein